MAGWNLQLDYGTAVLGRMMQSFGLAFLFIPINVAAFAYVPRDKTNMGTGIINLARNIGASVGIATVTTMLQRRSQFHQSQLVERMNPMNAAYQNMINGTHGNLDGAWSKRHAGDLPGAQHDLQDSGAPGSNAGVSGQFQDAGRGFFRDYSNIVPDEAVRR